MEILESILEIERKLEEQLAGQDSTPMGRVRGRLGVIDLLISSCVKDLLSEAERNLRAQFGSGWDLLGERQRIAEIALWLAGRDGVGTRCDAVVTEIYRATAVNLRDFALSQSLKI